MRGFRAVLCAGMVVAAGPVAGAQEPDTPVPHTVPRIESHIEVDGVLDEPSWGSALVIPLPYEVHPGDNVPPPVRTECLLAFDDRHLYVAFRAYDPEPALIRAHLSDRDTSFRDDLVGVFLDTFNDERRGVELLVNPLGVQSDLVRNDVGAQGDSEDPTWDAIWDSAGRITEDGYQVEMAVPFSSLRFPKGEGAQIWGILAFRAYPRTYRHQLFSRPLDRNRNCFFCQAGKVTGFSGIDPGGRLEIVPTLTARREDLRENIPAGPLEHGGVDSEVGVTGRFALTPNLILGGTVNPDFSQVEADVAQLTVNTRFALFYPEKRPFFLESADFFTTPLNAVYTRTVADPSWGVKLSGKTGPGAIGIGLGEDRVTSLVLPSNQGSEIVSLEQPNRPSVLRYRHDVGGSSTLGVLYTGREGDGYHNRAYGADGHLRLTPLDTVFFQYLASDTRYPEQLALDNGQPVGTFADDAFRVHYQHESREWHFRADYRDLGRGFRADAGFIPRVDFRRAGGAAIRTWWMKEGSAVTRLSAGVSGERIENHAGILTDENLGPELEMQGPRQMYLNARVARAKEYFEGVTYNQTRGDFFFNIRPTGSFTTSMEGSLGGAIDYDNGRAARRVRLAPGITWDFGRHLHLQMDHAFERLSVAGGTLYTANLTQARIVYQFTVRAFARMLLQRTSVDRARSLYLDPATEPAPRDLLAQVLFSYKVNPQTLFFVGYSEQRSNEGEVDIRVNERAVFFKIGYAWLP